MWNLPFREIVALDFEYISRPGATPVPVCLVARELISRRLHRIWLDGHVPARPPFPIDDDTLFVAFMASAEWGCFRALSWPRPTRVLDLYAEYKNLTNGRPGSPSHPSLLHVLHQHGLPTITSEQKDAERALVLRGGPWTPSERRRVLTYCQNDVDPLEALLERMLPRIRARSKGLGQALLRGRYTVAVAAMEHAGVPLDVGTLAKLRERWPDIRLDLIRDVDIDYGVYDGDHFREHRFAAWLARHRIGWPLHETGRLKLDQDTFKDMARTYPELGPLRELRHSLSEMRLEELAVGPDGRNRCMLSPYGASTGRNTPSNSKFIFGPSVWLRSLIQPTRGRALAYVDWSSQEIWIAARLSGDEAMLEAVQSGDPYLAFGKLAKLVPPDATKASHPAERHVFKTCLLGVNYGLGAGSLAYRVGWSKIEARDLLRRLEQVFPAYSAWAEQVVDAAYLEQRISTVFGWTAHVTCDSRATTLRNFPMQAHGAHMLQLACCLATEAGVKVCAPVHDALLVEADERVLDTVVATTRAAMAEASRIVLDGLEVRTEVDQVVRWPGRFMDEKRGRKMWEKVTSLL